MKRARHPSSSDDSDNGSSWSQHSKSHPRRGKGKKPSEVFRTDLITAMKVHDSYQLNLEDFYVLADPWRQEWEKGVQVPVSPGSVPQPVARVIADKGSEIMFTKPKKLIRTSGSGALGYVDIITLANGMCRYDLNEEDVAWLQLINEEFCEMGMPMVDEMTMERVIEEFERRCCDNMSHAVETEEGLGIEYDEDVVCDVCQSPDGEDNNEMVFCDKCNICVHQACYGIQKVPEGSWLCRICALGIVPKCQLCPQKGGAMKPTRSGTKWVHVSCALWIPEVSIGNPEKMEPITNVSHIPSNRWALVCCLCKEKTGACIQCSAKNCRTAFHVTCGLHRGLEMNTILTEEDEVKFKAYCPEHSGLEGGEGRAADSGDEKDGATDPKSRRRGRVRGDADKATAATPLLAPQEPEGLSSSRQQQQQQEEKRVNFRKLKLQQLEEEFFQFVDSGEVAEHLKLSKEAVDFLYQYWKLKRKANFDQPLLTPKKDEEDSLARREQEVLLRRLQLFTHLRQDLERVRNLTYMVTRREKMKRSLWRVQDQIFQHQVRLLEQDLLTGEVSTDCLKDIMSIGIVPTPGSVTTHSSVTKRIKKERKGSHKRSATDEPHNPREREEPKRPVVKEETDNSSSKPDKLVSSAQLLQPKLEVSCVRLPTPEEEGSIWSEYPFPDLHQRRVSVVLTRLKPGNDLHTEERKKKRSGLRDKSPGPVRTKTRPGASAEDGLDGASTQPTPVSTSPKPNGWLRKEPGASTQANGPLLSGGATGSHLKNWGKFRIPKRTGRPLEVKEQEVSESAGPQQRKLLLRPHSNTSEPSYPRTRLRTGTENGYTPEAKAGKSDGKKPCVKRCHSHQLRGGDSLCRGYCSDIIRRGVLIDV